MRYVHSLSSEEVRALHKRSLRQWGAVSNLISIF